MEGLKRRAALEKRGVSKAACARRGTRRAGRTAGLPKSVIKTSLFCKIGVDYFYKLVKQLTHFPGMIVT